MKIFITFIIAAFAFSSLSHAEVKLGSREVLLDNEKVEMLRLIYPVGTESGIHTHIYANRAAYFVKGGKLELIPSDKNGKIRILEVPDGGSAWLPATTHNVKNIGTTEVIIIETEIK